MYCVYTNKDVAEVDGNFDHIIPLSLGGDNKFVVWCEEKYNSHVGSKIDGKLANDQLIMLARNRADARGHSDRKPIPKWVKSEFRGRPVQVSWGEEVRVWDAKANTYLDSSEFLNEPIKSRWIYDPSARCRFTAKVALGGGYFYFGQTFLTSTNCDELRNLILAEDVSNFQTNLIAHDPVLKGRWRDESIIALRPMCEFTGRTTLIVLPVKTGIVFCLGVLGMYVGAIFCPGDISGLKPEDGEVFLFAPEPMDRLPLREFATKFQNHQNDFKTTERQEESGFS